MVIFFLPSVRSADSVSALFFPRDAPGGRWDTGRRCSEYDDITTVGIRLIFSALYDIRTLRFLPWPGARRVFKPFRGFSMKSFAFDTVRERMAFCVHRYPSSSGLFSIVTVSTTGIVVDNKLDRVDDESYYAVAMVQTRERYAREGLRY